ncbi:MAG: septum formation initiator family protein [Rickettsiales bacterium]|jgi:cell division protein FtsB|nr:septum formation initiator family protein [Rickettsiales bacterium]
MFGKIKQLLEFLRLALRGGWQGVIGALLIPLALWLLFAAVFDEGGLVQLVKLSRAEARMERVVAEKRAKLDDLNLHIGLLNNRSPDYMEELIQKRLNMAEQGTKVLK